VTTKPYSDGARIVLVQSILIKFLLSDSRDEGTITKATTKEHSKEKRTSKKTKVLNVIHTNPVRLHS